jgi:hypothetical protein
MEISSVIESSVSLSYANGYRAEVAVALGRGVAALSILLPPAAGIFVLTSLNPSPNWIDLLFGSFLIGFMPFMFLFSAYRGLKLAARNGPYAYRISPEGFELKSRTAELKQAWPGIQRVNISRGFILIYASKRCAYHYRSASVRGTGAGVLAMAKAGGVARVGT